MNAAKEHSTASYDPIQDANKNISEIELLLQSAEHEIGELFEELEGEAEFKLVAIESTVILSRQRLDALRDQIDGLRLIIKEETAPAAGGAA